MLIIHGTNELLLTLINTAAMAQKNEIAKEKWHWDNKSKQDTIAGYVRYLENSIEIQPLIFIVNDINGRGN